MTVTKSPIFLLDVARASAEPAELWDAITESQLTDWEGEWLPELFKALQRLRRAGVDRRHWPQVAIGTGGGRRLPCRACWGTLVSASCARA